MKFREIFTFEFEGRVRSAATWIFAALIALFAAWMFLFSFDGTPGLQFNTPDRIAYGSVLVGIFGVLISAALFSEAAVRDVAVGMDQLLYTSPITRTEYLGGRFLAALAVNAMVALVIPLGILADTVFAAAIEPVGAFRFVAYVHAYFLFTLPNLIVVGAILYAIGMLSRQVIPVYLAAIGLFIAFIVALNYEGRIANPILAALVDPMGIATLRGLTKYWTVSDRNTQLLGFPAALVLNRIVWLVIATGTLAFMHRRFRFEHADGGSPWRRERRTATLALKNAIVDNDAQRSQPVARPRVAGTFTRSTALSQILAVARLSFESITRSRAFVIAVLVAMGLVLLWGWNVGSTVFDTSTWPVTYLVAETALSIRLQPLIFILIAVYAGELVWKERDVNFAEIADAAPVSDAVALLGRFVALVAMLVVFETAFMVSGILLQLLQGYYHIELGLYVRLLFGVNLTGYVLLAALAMTIHVLVNQKYVGHIIAIVACAFTVAANSLGIRHHLLVYSTDPGWTYSDMNGFGPFLRPFVWFKLYWAAWALLLLVVSTLFAVRGREPGWRRRLGQARARLAGPMIRTAGVATVLIVTLGGFIFYNTNILNAYHTPEEFGAPAAAYEKKYKKFERAPQPDITTANLRIEIYPERPSAELRGTYRLMNRTGAAIETVHVYVIPDVHARAIAFDRVSTPVVVDNETGFRTYALAQPLEPGDSLSLTFDVAFEPHGFPNSGAQTDVVRNGAYFNRAWLPFIGYQPAFELKENEARQRFGLARLSGLPGADDMQARQFRNSARGDDAVRITTVIGTAVDQTALTPGVLRKSWMENGRRYARYETEVPTSFSATVFSARYAVVEDHWRDVDLRIYHHSTHTFALDRMVKGMKASLEYYTDQFGPYTDKQLQIVEIPRYRSFFGRAHAHTIATTEDNFLSRVDEGEIDQPFYGIAHEVAHQWWGGQVRGAMVKGHGFLTESLANYSAMMVTEQVYGVEAARRVFGYQMLYYLRGRATQSREVPLLDVEDQSYINYRKGAIAMYTLRELIGAKHVNAALRRYLDANRAAVPPYPTSRDLYREFQKETPDSLQYVLRDWFENVTLWELKTTEARVEATGTGEYRVTLDMVAKKVTADSAGKETEVPMNDMVDIGVFMKGPDGANGETLYLKPHRITSGKQTISIVVPRVPARAGIDPHYKLTNRKREENVVDVKASATAAPIVRSTSRQVTGRGNS